MAVDLLVCVATEFEGALLRSHAPASVTVLCTGVGAVNAAYSLTKFVTQERPGAIVVCGIAGAYPGSELSVGSVACAESECYGDLGAASPEGFLDMRTLGFPLVPGPAPLYNAFPMQVFPGSRREPFVTVNTCTGSDDAARAMRNRTGGAVESMEGAAIAHVAALSAIPVGEIRGISNMAGHRDRVAWRVQEAANAAQDALLKWIAVNV